MKGWGVYIAIALGVFVYNAVTEAGRDDTGAIVDGGNVDACQIRAGDCFDDASSMEDEISSLPGVPCADPHDNEAYAVFEVSFADYPEGDEMSEFAYSSCMERFESFVGTDYQSSVLDIFTMYPSPESWKQDDREVVCAIYDMNAEKLTGSMKGRAL